MPSLKAIRTRIASVKNTQKITKAMKLVAAARLRRAQDAIVAARPYAQRLTEVLGDVTARLSLEAGEESHPLLAKRQVKTARLIIISADRGLAGGFNSNLARRIERFLVDEKEHYPAVELAIVGRKAREHFKRRLIPGSPYGHVKVVAEHTAAASDTAVVRARELATQATDDFLDGKIDAVLVAFNEFKSAISQVVCIETMLPIEPAKLPEGATRFDFEYEPSKGDVLSTLVPLYIEITLYRAMLESIASFFGAQMSAMDNATKNAKEMIGNLTLQFNRARQAAITKELMEIVGGAEALKG
ncbi:MAG TPA: ATP synthase F1 subunit gamma [Polyangia bacterium]|jgi:F-type H+-transporting ATPase subunit gamma|nr:ATP synthase F1 subunit gamma [Polyangia bacterium]